MGAGVTAQSILVSVLPPSDCFRMRVSFESRYGMNTGFSPFLCRGKAAQVLSVYSRYTIIESSSTSRMVLSASEYGWSMYAEL
jgi:hypothetical protein